MAEAHVYSDSRAHAHMKHPHNAYSCSESRCAQYTAVSFHVEMFEHCLSQCVCALTADRELQRVSSHLLHLVPPAGRILRPQHVRRRRRRELPQVSREPGGGGEGEARRETRQEDGQETTKYARGLRRRTSGRIDGG